MRFLFFVFLKQKKKKENRDMSTLTHAIGMRLPTFRARQGRRPGQWRRCGNCLRCLPKCSVAIVEALHEHTAQLISHASPRSSRKKLCQTRHQNLMLCVSACSSRAMGNQRRNAHPPSEHTRSYIQRRVPVGRQC